MRKHWISRILGGLFLSVAGISVALAISEGMLRIFLDAADVQRLRARTGPLPIPQWANHPFLPLVGIRSKTWEKSQIVNGAERRVEIRNNAYGFRTHEFVRKSPDEFVVVCLGGSTTWGEAAATNAKTWPERLERHLAAALPNRKVRVYNLGVPTATSANSAVTFALLGSRLRPDVVIVYHGINEIGALLRIAKWDYSHVARDMGAVDPPRANRLPPKFQTSLLALWVADLIDTLSGAQDLSSYVTRRLSIGDFVELGARVLRSRDRTGLVRFADMQLFLENLETIEAMAALHGGRTLFATFQFHDPGPELIEFNQRLRAWFRREAKPWLDVDAALPDHGSEINYDDCHFTDEGERRMARLMFDAIVEQHWIPTSTPLDDASTHP